MFSSSSPLRPQQGARTARAMVAAMLLAGAAIGNAARAQSALPTPAPEPEPGASRLQRIVVEDAGSRIEEARVGGVTRQIEVQPKTGAPAYQIQPTSIQGPATSASERTGQPGGAGRASWRVFSF